MESLDSDLVESDRQPVEDGTTVPLGDEAHLHVDIWGAFYKAWLTAFLEVVSTKAAIGHRMRASMNSSYGQRWTTFWPYSGGRARRDVPTSTIGGWIERASLPTDPGGNVLVTKAIRQALVIVVTEELKDPPAEVARLAERAGIEPPAFSVVVGKLGQLRDSTQLTFTAEVDNAVKATRDRLMRLPSGYPPHLRTLRLAEQLRVFKVEDLDELTKGDGLYAASTPYGSTSPALATLAVDRLAVVLGDPGSGKSTLLAAHCARYINDWAGLAIFVRLDDLGQMAIVRRDEVGGALTLEDAIDLVIDAWDNWRQQRSPKRTREFIADRIINGAETLVAFDGLDEVALVDDRSAEVREILRLLERSCQARLIVASRVTAYRRPFEQATEYFVDRLDAEDVEAFVVDWFSDRPSEDAGRQAALRAVKDDRVGHLARTPVIAGIVCYVAEDGAVESTAFGLYRQYLNRYLRRSWRPAAEQRITLAAVDRARMDAQRLAWAMAGLDGEGVGAWAWLDKASLNWLRARTNVESSELLELYQRDGLLVSFGMPADSDPMSQQVRWLHRTVHEHLAGRHLAEQLSRDGQSGLALLVQAALRPEWGVAIEHLAGALAELGILEPTVDALWVSAAENNRVSWVLSRVGAMLLVIGGSDHRRDEVVDHFVRHHEWALLSDLDRPALLGGLRDAVAAGRSATEAGFIQTFVARLDPPPEGGWEVVELLRELSRRLDLGYEWIIDDLAWRVDPRRMFDLFVDRLERSLDLRLPWGEGALLLDEESSRVAQLVVDQLDQGNLRPYLDLDHWLRTHYPSASEHVERAARDFLGDAFVDERAQAWRDDRPFDWDAVSADERAHFFLAAHPWGPFNFGWDLAERGLPLPVDAAKWTQEAYRLGLIKWWEDPPAEASVAEATESTGREEALTRSWSDSPSALRRTRATMLAYASVPSLDRVREVLVWCCEAEPSDYNENFLHLDANWFHSFVMALPWQLRVEAGLLELGRLSEHDYPTARQVVAWTLDALGDGLRDDPSEPTLELIEQLAVLLITGDGDPQVTCEVLSFMQSGMDGVSPETTAQVVERFEARVVEVLPHDSELSISILDGIDHARYRAGLLPDVYAQRQSRS